MYIQRTGWLWQYLYHVYFPEKKNSEYSNFKAYYLFLLFLTKKHKNSRKRPKNTKTDTFLRIQIQNSSSSYKCVLLSYLNVKFKVSIKCLSSRKKTATWCQIILIDICFSKESVIRSNPN